MSLQRLEAPKFKFIKSTRTRAMNENETVYHFESMQEDGLSFAIAVKDDVVKGLESGKAFKALLREKCIAAYNIALLELEEKRKKEEFEIHPGDVI